MESLNNIAQAITQFVSSHGDLIKWTTAGLAAVAALVIVLLHNLMPRQRWAKFFAGAFFVLAFQYLFYIIFHQLDIYQIGKERWTLIQTTFDGLVAACSVLNNLLFLAAARHLRDKDDAFPLWAIGLGVVSGIAYVLLPRTLAHDWARLPDALFSAYCFNEVSYALSVNMSFRPRAAAIITLVAGFCYAVLQVVHGFNPILAHILAQAGDPVSYKASLELLDSLAMVFVLPLKFLFFLSALYLLLRSLVILTASDVEKMSQQVVEGRSEYLTNEGIVKSIGETVRAEAVELFVKHPGIKPIALFEWQAGIQPQVQPQMLPLPTDVKSIEGWILLEGAGVFPELPEGGKGLLHREGKYFLHRDSDGLIKHIVGVDSKMLTVGVPVRYHGAIIACLKLEWKIVGLLGVERLRRKMKPSPALRTTVISHVKRLADMLAPGVQSFREVAALNSFGNKFAKLQVKPEASDIEEAVGTITEYLQDVLSPIETRVQIEIGFREFSKVKPDGASDDEATPSQNGQPARLSSPLSVIGGENGDDTGFPIGQLILTVPSGRDEIGRPTLATNERYRLAVASLISDAVLDSARDHLSSILKNLGVNLNSDNTLNVPGWLQWVEQAAKEAGLLWAVAKQSGTRSLLGSFIGISVIEGLWRDGQREADGPCHYWPVDPPIEQLNGVIELRLPNTGAQLWFGVPRAGFGIELKFPSPWRLFLEHFAEIADAALVRLLAAVEMENLLTEAAKYQGLATVAVTTGTIIHQVVNLLKDIIVPADALLESYRIGDLTCDTTDARLIEVLSNSAHQSLELTRNIINVTKLDKRRPCSLHEATLESTKLYDLSLNQQGIRLINNVPPEIHIDIFFYIAALAIDNLVSNAKDAIIERGKESQPAKESRIVITAEESEDLVRCYVTDNGPGIPEAIRDHVFEIGVTTKEKSGGWGLYLVRRSLRENGADIALPETGPDGTKFTIFFPKERKR